MTAVLANVLWPLGIAAYGAAASAGLGRRWGHCRMLAVLGSGLLLAECALVMDWRGLAENAVLVAVLLGWDWWNRKGRKAAKALGLKSLALLAAVVEKAREAGTPVPEGAPG